jgi:hypothetical protein
VLNHLFHGELSTLYEESSSLECSSYGNSSTSASTVGAASVVAPSAQECSSTTDSIASLATVVPDDDSSKEAVTTTSSKNHRRKKKTNVEEKHAGASVSTGGSNRSQESFVDDCVVQMRWEYSLGRMDGYSEQWRQPMPLMNEEELSSDYVAEI